MAEITREQSDRIFKQICEDNERERIQKFVNRTLQPNQKPKTLEEQDIERLAVSARNRLDGKIMEGEVKVNG